MKNIDILIIGAGISGAVLAERYASLGKQVLIIEKKNHIAAIYQALPEDDYTQLFRNILNHSNIKILFNTEYCDIKNEYGNYEKLFYTGLVDDFVEFTQLFSEKLACRSIHFVSESTDYELLEENVEDLYSENNYSEKEAFVNEFITKDQVYYSVPSALNDENTELHLKQKLTNYSYFNIDQEFKNALDLFHQLEKSNEAIYKTAV